MMEMFQSLGAYWPGVKILAGELYEVNTYIHTYKYLYKYITQTLNIYFYY